jgi:hypothetical protein
MKESRIFENKPKSPEISQNQEKNKKEKLKEPLSPEEIKKELSRIKTEFCTDLEEKTGAVTFFPEGTKIGNVDMSKKTLEEVLNLVLDPLENYEPPIVQEQVETEFKKEVGNGIPKWLEGYENLIWTGASENPIWEVQGRQYEDEVIVSYVRKLKELKPGKSKMEQGKSLELVKNSFTLEEWKIMNQIFKQYEKLEKNRQSDDPALRKEANRQILEVVKEENANRKNRGGMPEILSSKMNKVFEDVASRTRGFKKEKIDIDVLTQQTAEILSQLVVLNRTRGQGAEKALEPKLDIKEIPSFTYSLSELSRCLNAQLENKKGVALMIGEAGTGKNEAVEYFAAKTNRPVFVFPCGRGMESIDLVTHYEFDSKEGTKRFMTDLAEGIQTPGAVVMIDEVNALKEEVQALLHGLGDSRRSLKYDGVNIPVAEGAVIIIAGNPATYGAAGNIGQALLSRTRGQSMIMEYPALKKGELMQRKEKWSDATLEQKEQENNELRDYACDEALILYPHLEEFKNLNDEDFTLLWDVSINEQTQGEKITVAENKKNLKDLLLGEDAQSVEKTLIDLRDILEITDKWRKYNEKKQGGFDIIGVSMRDTISVVQAYAKKRDVRKAYLDVMNDFRKNPIDGLEYTFKALEQLIDDTLSRQSQEI